MTTKVYAVHTGRVPGIYMNWEDCLHQVQNYPKARYKKFDNPVDALAFVQAPATPTKREAASSFRNPISPSRPPAPIPRAIAAPSTPQPETAAASSGVLQEDLIVYCDGACPNNGKPNAIAGIGVWWGGGDSRNLSERCPGPQTNNRAELIAIIRVLETAPAARSLTIKTDSKYCIQCIVDWLPKWRINNFTLGTGKPAQNRPLIEYLDALMQHRRNKGQRVELFHVRGHHGETGNEGADFLANRGVFMAEEKDRDWEKARKAVELGLGQPEPEELVASQALVAVPNPEIAQSRPETSTRAIGVSQLVMDDYDSIDMNVFFQGPTPIPSQVPTPAHRGMSTPPPPPSPVTNAAAFTTPPRNQPMAMVTSPTSVDVRDVNVDDYADCVDDLAVDSEGEFA